MKTVYVNNVEVLFSDMTESELIQYVIKRVSNKDPEVESVVLSAEDAAHAVNVALFECQDALHEQAYFSALELRNSLIDALEEVEETVQFPV
jgi:hypothetical protein